VLRPITAFRGRSPDGTTASHHCSNAFYDEWLLDPMFDSGDSHEAFIFL
jgi:hypothetical protein